MRDRKIASTLKDAIDSPIGSTKRKAAKNLIDVMTKVMRRRYADGMGGPGYRYSGQGGPGSPRYSPTTPGSSFFMTKAPRKDPDYSNMIIFPSPPGPRRGNPMTKAMAPQAQSGQDYLDKQISAAFGGSSGEPQQALSLTPPVNNFNPGQMPDISAAFSNVSPPKQDGQGGPGFSNLSASSAGGLQPASSPSFGGTFTLPTLPTTPQKSLLSGTGASSLSGFSSLSGIPSPSSKLTIPGSAPTTPSPKPSAPTGIPKWNVSTGTFEFGLPQPTPTPGTPKTPTPNVGMTEEQRTTLRAQGEGARRARGEAPSGTTGATGTTGTTGSTQTKTPPQTPTPTPKSPIESSLASGIAGGLSATAWAQGVMGNQDLLKQIFPNEQNLPASASLADAVNSLSETLKEQYKIKELQDQMLDMTANGITFGPMLQTYIQNKDVSLNKIYDQMQNAQEKMLHSDKGNPYEATIWSRYNDYLNNLYTAQHASYADFYNKSVTMYQNALSALNTTLSTSINQYNSELTTKAGLLEADYNRIYQSLTDMYTQAQDAPAKELQLATLRTQLALANGQLVGVNSTVGQGEWVNEYKKLTDMGILFDNATGEGGTSNARYGTLMPDVTDLGGAIQTIISDNPKIGVDGALYIIGQAFQKSLQSADATQAISEANRFQGMILEAVSEGYIPETMGTQMIESMTPAVSRSVSSFFSDAGRAEVAKSAMKDALVGSGWLGKKIPTLAEFEKKYSEQLTKELADAIYQQMNDTKSIIASAQASGGQGSTDPSPYVGKSLEEIYEDLADEIDSLGSPEDVGSYVSNLITPLVVGKGIMALQPVGT